ncbi:MAG: carbohydrate ABC transporter permease [Faecousia sp.]
MAKKKKISSDSTISMVETPTAADRVVDVIVIILCGLVAFCSVIPMWHVLMSSISDGKALLAHSGLVILPIGDITFKGYEHIFKNAGILSGYINAIIYTVSATACGFILATLSGYALSRQTKIKPIVTALIMFTMLFSGGMVPTYMVIKALGWVGTRWALIIPGCTNAMFIVMMMNAFNSVPKEMYEAARIDGAGHLRTMTQIMLPQAMNLGSVIILNSVVGQWNSWLSASIYVPNKKNLWPLQLWVKQITADNENFLSTSNPDYSRYLIKFAVVIAATLPIIILFPFFQDKLEKGVIAGGIKG